MTKDVHNPVANPDAQLVVGSQRITILTEGLFRFESTQDGEFEDRASTFALNRALPKPKFSINKSELGGFDIVTDRVLLSWDGKAFSPNGLTALLRGAGGDWSTTWRYGGKEHKQSNLGGTARTLDEVDGRCDFEDGVLSQYGFSSIDDSDSTLFTEDGWVAPRKAGRTDLYLFTYGNDYRAALGAFYKISGNVPLLPRWALGNWWSRYYNYSADSYLALMDKFRKHDIPLSVAVLDMDWHLVDVPGDFGTGWTGYTWNEELFPDHVKFLKDLHDRGLKATPNLHPADGVRSYEKLYPEMCKALGKDPKAGLPIPFDCTDRKFMDAYFKVLHNKLEDEGVDFWWVDWQQGPFSRVPGIDPLWVLNHFHYLDSGRRGERRFTFSRYAGPGSHRYPVGFSGDTFVTWDSLKFQPEFTATASNIGYGWWSHDIGGHMQGFRNDELYARWVQLGLWSPLLRLHSSNSPFNTREPWAFNTESQAVATAALQFRHRLVPYLYTSAVRAATEGKNVVEPVYYDYPSVSEAYAYKNEFFFGDQLLVIPAVTPRVESTVLTRTEGWLPPGRWIDIFTGAVYDGDRIVTVHRTLEQYPVFAKEGAIVPLDAAELSELPNGCALPEIIELLLVVGKDASFDLVEDDGTGAEISQVKFSSTEIKYDQASGTLTIHPASNPLFTKRTWKVRLVAHTPKSVSAHINGQAVELDTTSASISLGKHSTDATITVSFGSDPQLDKRDVKAAVFEVLDRTQILLNEKDALWRLFNSTDLSNLGLILSRVKAITTDEDVLSAIEEVLLADSRK